MNLQQASIFISINMDYIVLVISVILFFVQLQRCKVNKSFTYDSFFLGYATALIVWALCDLLDVWIK